MKWINFWKATRLARSRAGMENSAGLILMPTSQKLTALFPKENLIMVLEPEYLMLSLWLFFLLIEAFTKMTFSLSSTYVPRLPNDVFVPGRARNLFVLTAVPREGGWAPHVGGCGEQRSSTQSRKQRHGGSRRKAPCVPNPATPGQRKDPEGMP